MFTRITLIFPLLILAPIASHAQSADSLRLLWQNEAISGVTAHAFSHSGKILALALAYDHEIKFWDLKEAKFIKTIAIPAHSYDQMAFTPNDDEIVLLSPAVPKRHGRGIDPEAPEPTDGFGIQVNVQTGEASVIQKAVIDNAKWALSSDSRSIAVLSDSGNLSIRASRDFSILSTLQLPVISSSYLASMYKGWVPPYEVWFSANSREVITSWGGQLTIYDTRTLQQKKILSDSVNKWVSPTIGEESIFIPKDNVSHSSHQRFATGSAVFTSKTWIASRLQPPSVNIPKIADRSPLAGQTNIPKSAMLFGNGKYLGSRYAMWLEQLIDYGTPRGEDTIIITTSSHPEYDWGIRLTNFMQILDVIPDHPDQLLLGDGSTFMILDAERHSVRYLSVRTVASAGFANDGQTILVRDQRDLYSFDGSNWRRIGWAGAAPSDRASNAPFLKGYLRALPAGDDKVFAYMDFWSKNNMAKIFDLRTGDSSLIFPAGLNYGVSAGAVSHDNKWIATVSGEGEGRLWRASDASLKTCFAAKEAYEAVFPINDRHLVYSAVYGNDSGISLLDLMTGEVKRICLGDAKVSSFELNADNSRLLVYRYMGLKGEMGPAIIELYETPRSWRSNDTSFNPNTVYLPLRFYLPKEAPDALDTNGMPFNPPRTQVELELRYGNGKLLKKILDGPLHKGKWHEWIYDMTPYPKGTYIMHTEIGGVMKDEKMEVR